HVELTRNRIRVSYGNKAAADPFAQVRIGEAASDIDAAWLQLEHHMTELMRLARAGEKMPMPLRLAIRRDQVRGTGRSIAAIDKLFESSGGRALRTGTPIQRFWRDAHAGRVHAINDPERALALYGTGELGLPVQDAMV
ncbi:MAG: 3-hydroxy-9,10-secoandrosta,3,5(10)-triene-9,17-dione monooxygenase, partial [Pseudonocardiales bacterium]|nr:3-hydroxy-9,10-secoandrosta,3,5(10)-triene-9,17-dione monooxygenase [Pseudonocardiales bacterium]